MARPHGVRGALVVFSPEGKNSSLASLKYIHAGIDRKTALPYRVTSTAWMPRGWVVQLNDVTDFDAANGMRNLTVFANRSELPLLAPDQYYVVDLIGFEVLDENGKNTGVFQGVESPNTAGPLHDLWIVKSEASTFLIPAVRHFIREIDANTRTIRVSHLEELP